MQSIRSRLTLSYTLALTVTMVVFGAAVYWERAASAGREAEQQLDGRLLVEAQLTRTTLRQQAKPTGSVVTGVRILGREADTSWVLANEVRAYLEGLRDYLWIADESGTSIFTSSAASNVGAEATRAVRNVMLRQPLEVAVGTIDLIPGTPRFRYYLLPVDSAGQHVRSLLVAAQSQPDERGPQQLLISMIFMAPIVLVASAVLGNWLAGNSLQPVDVMIEELQAIQDGRSLHRRLAVPPGEDEISRLGSQLNAMLGRVEQSFVALRRFTADASHELKTPLMVLRAGVERSLTHPKTPPEIVGVLDETLRQINQMGELVTNLLTLARADEGRSALQITNTDLRALVADAGETAEILGEQENVGVTFELPASKVMAPVDAGRIRQLLMNLITNAIKYTPAGGRVVIRLSEDDKNVSLQVQDSGIGIAPGDTPNVFERFWRADPARTRTGDRPGTGLGLAISKWIVDAHGGTIGVQSRPGRGSTFTATLPKAPLEPGENSVSVP
jgi:signal transduction histidine kinase